MSWKGPRTGLGSAYQVLSNLTYSDDYTTVGISWQIVVGECRDFQPPKVCITRAVSPSRPLLTLEKVKKIQIIPKAPGR